MISSSDQALKIIANNKDLLKKVNEIELDMAEDMIFICEKSHNKTVFEDVSKAVKYTEQLINQVEESTKKEEKIKI